MSASPSACCSAAGRLGTPGVLYSCPPRGEGGPDGFYERLGWRLDADFVIGETFSWLGEALVAGRVEPVYGRGGGKDLAEAGASDLVLMAAGPLRLIEPVARVYIGSIAALGIVVIAAAFAVQAVRGRRGDMLGNAIRDALEDGAHSGSSVRHGSLERGDG